MVFRYSMRAVFRVIPSIIFRPGWLYVSWIWFACEWMSDRFNRDREMVSQLSVVALEILELNKLAIKIGEQEQQRQDADIGQWAQELAKDSVKAGESEYGESVK